MKNEDIEHLYQDFILPTYKHLPICLVKGKGARVWDLQNREYLDFFPGWAVSGLGHCHPMVVHAIKEQARKMIHISNNFLNAKQAQLAARIVQDSFPSQIFFCNSGAESTEAAIKFARRYGSETERHEIVTMRLSFHGRTLGAVAATGQERIQKGYDPRLQGFVYADMNDLESVKKAIGSKTVAIFLEPIQGEGGLTTASLDFMKGLRELCHQHDLLLMLDEVQTAMGRTGKLFAYQHYDIEPDVMTLAKSLGGGVPIGALVVNRNIAKQVFEPGTHGSTFGGNPMVCAASLAVFKAIQKEKLLTNAVRMGDYLGQKLEHLKRKYRIIEEIRGLALMRGLKLNVSGKHYVDKALEKGLLINVTQETVIRIFPPLNVTKKLIDQAMKILDDVFYEVQIQSSVENKT